MNAAGMRHRLDPRRRPVAPEAPLAPQGEPDVEPQGEPPAAAVEPDVELDDGGAA